MLWTIGYNISHYFKHLQKTEKIYHFLAKTLAGKTKSSIFAPATQR